MPGTNVLMTFFCSLFLAGMTMTVYAQSGFVANLDETQVPEYTLPDPLIGADGTPVTDAETWYKTRRGEIFALFEREMYGKTPEAAKARKGKLRYVQQSEKSDALDGKATRREVRLLFSNQEDGPYLDLLVYVPNTTTGPVPAFLGLNFQGNHTITDEPDIRMPKWVPTQDNRDNAPLRPRGSLKSRWPIEMIIDRGYALAVGYYCDIDPDYDDGFQNGAHPLFYHEGQTQRDADEWGNIGAWSWGLSRALDYLETCETVDAKRIAVFGHSRLGKTALWTGTQDERFAMVISNNSGSGGAAISRRAFGETIGLTMSVRPHWFCVNFNKYNKNEAALPMDQHELVALIAPRPVYIASAEKDAMADPKGELLAGLNADAVYRLLGTDGIGDAARNLIVTEKDGMVYDVTMPPLDEPVGATIRYHIRTGEHDVTEYDWRQYLDFADEKL
ncbi:MAG: acetylxylan esterase [Planctomycetaceae bacterium]|nr:acetylxylan esterase [Planctomycetaceae bacterium]